MRFAAENDYYELFAQREEWICTFIWYAIIIRTTITLLNAVCVKSSSSFEYCAQFTSFATLVAIANVIRWRWMAQII